MRAFSVVRDSQSVELSQGRVASKAAARNVAVEDLKLGQIIDFASGKDHDWQCGQAHALMQNEAKEKEWDNIITCHTSDSGAHTWSMKNKRIGSHKLVSRDDSEVKVCPQQGKTSFADHSLYGRLSTLLHAETLAFLAVNPETYIHTICSLVSFDKPMAKVRNISSRSKVVIYG